MIRDLFDLMGGDNDRTSMNGNLPAQHDMIELELVVHGESELSVNVSETGSGKVIPLPRKEIKVTPTGRRTDNIGKPKFSICNVVMPEWLAKDRGLI